MGADLLQQESTEFLSTELRAAEIPSADNTVCCSQIVYSLPANNVQEIKVQERVSKTRADTSMENSSQWTGKQAE